MNFSYIDNEQSKTVPPVVKNAGIYGDRDSFSGKPWGNDYIMPKITPDAESYASQFYAKNHIPSNNRPGNNPPPSLYKYFNTEMYNFKCYKQ